MNKARKFVFFVLLGTSIILVLLALIFLYSDQIAVLNPKGIIGLKERNLIFVSLALMLIVVLPVFAMTTIFCWRYRAGNPKAKYRPNWDYSLLAEAIWWGIPCAIIFVIAMLTWESSHELDPYKPIESDKKPLKIQVVALPWNWLFIYPEQQIATVNFFHFPEHTPVNFEITADAPMNSFWIPQLGGQIYAMPGMRTKLALIADESGSYKGLSANLSGKGFASMTFIAQATSEADFEQWVKSVKQSSSKFGMPQYLELAKPNESHPVVSFALSQGGLFDDILMKYMMPMPSK